MSHSSTTNRFPNLVIRASAGSGKTYQLSNRYLALLSAGQAAEQILATTFTRKAAGEILNRILLRLANAALDEDEAAELAGAIGDPTLTCEKSKTLLVGAMQNLHRLRVGTLDSFFIKAAGSFNLELDLPPGWRIGDLLSDERLRDEAIEAVLDADSTQELLSLMHLLTKGETTRGVSQLIRDTVKNLYGLFQETTPEAWRALKRPSGLKPDELESTIEDLRAVEFPSDKRFEKARLRDYQFAMEGDWESFISGGLVKPILTDQMTYYKKPIPQRAIDCYEKLLVHAKAELIGLTAMQTEAAYDLLTKFDLHYKKLKRERRIMGFDDVTRAIGSLSQTGNADNLLFRLDSGIEHVLLDEFQDTSLSQWRALRPFAQRVASGEDSSFFCVGDVKQAIYSWRGGVAEIFDALNDQLPGLSNQTLSTSYRSAQPIIDTVNRLFENLDKHTNLDRLASPIQRWSKKFSTHSTAKGNLAGYVSLKTAPVAEEGQDPQDAFFYYVAQSIRDLVEQSPGRSIGILVRKNSTVGRLIYLLRHMEIPASEEGGNPLTDSAAVELILSILRLADHPGDTASRFHLASSPLGPLVGLTNYKNDPQAEAFSKQARSKLLHQGYGATINEWVVRLAPICNPRDQNRLSQLVEMAYQYQSEATLRADDFIDFVEAERVADPSSAAVRVMTVHQAKGLQFDITVLPELDVRMIGQPGRFVVGRPSPTQPVDRICRYVNETIRSLLPKNFQKMFDDTTHQQTAEALCWLYVAMTRPVHALHMILSPIKENERSMPKSFAGLLRAALVDPDEKPQDNMLYQCGDPDWDLQQPKDNKSEESNDQEVATETIADIGLIKLAPPSSTPRRGLQRTSPSAMEGGSQVSLGELLEPGREEAMLRGSLIHGWFELIEWLDDAQPDESQLREVAMKIAPTYAELDALIKEFDAMLHAPQIRQALCRAAYQPPLNLGFRADLLNNLGKESFQLEAQAERYFAVRLDDQIVSGYIDRLVLLRRGDKIVAADILDFKTDAIETVNKNALQQKVDYYRPQLEAYRRAVSQMTKLDPASVSARLIFVGPAIVVDV